MAETSELTTRDLFLELKALTDPIEFGVGLGFELHEMEIIKRNHPSNIKDQKSDLFLKISRNHISKNITWATIAKTLENFMDQKDLALQIRKKYCPSESDNQLKCHKIDDIACTVGIDPDILDRPCNNETHLLRISKLINHWPSYAPLLGLTDQEVIGIQRDKMLTAFHAKPQRMLRRWQEKRAFTSEANYRFLLEACLEVDENAELVGKICELLK